MRLGTWLTEIRSTPFASLTSLRRQAVQPLGDTPEDATAILALPLHYRRRLRTTNGVERLNEEIRRCERVIRIFPNRESAVRLLGALLIEQDEAWATGHRYFDMTAYWHWRSTNQEEVPLPHSA